VIPCAATIETPLAWSWPIELGRYDRSPVLTGSELKALRRPAIGRRGGDHTAAERIAALDGAERLVRPLADAAKVVHVAAAPRNQAMVALLRGCLVEKRAFWGWDEATWKRELAPMSTPPPWLPSDHFTYAGASRHPKIAIAYLLGCLPSLRVVGIIRWQLLAQRVFGHRIVETNLARLSPVLISRGYSGVRGARLRDLTSELMIYRGSPLLEDLTSDFLNSARFDSELRPRTTGILLLLSRILTELELLVAPLPTTLSTQRRTPPPPGWAIAPEWVAAVTRWQETSTLSVRSRATHRHWLLKVGRWLRQHHPEIVGPSQWTRELAASSVAAIDRMTIGEYVHDSRPVAGTKLGQPLLPASKAHAIGALRRFFMDLQEWGLVQPAFNPQRAFAVPWSIRALIGPSPRTIGDEVWAKLLWAGLNLSDSDLPAHGAVAGGVRNSAHLSGGSYYPILMLRALATVWLFCGLRSDEIVRLRVGCIRWQDGADNDVPRVCMLDVPVHKTGHAFTKPVDAVVGDAVEKWEVVRPPQVAECDRKTGEQVSFLFSYRGRQLRVDYLNRCLIPLLCRKAGVPPADARGRITSHRARSTIATQLYNAKEPMTLFELQAWLGHRSPETTQRYTRITPTTLSRAYSDAGYFARNVRIIEVLIDRDAVVSGSAAGGEPWQYFDLGHGYCTYTFFEQCPHRMACARCDFYIPKDSSKCQLIEAGRNLQRMLVQIPLTEEERAAVEDGTQAIEALLHRLADVPTPAGPSPRELRPLPLQASARS
jgi:integrase